MDRRPLSAAVNAIPNADPDLAREFITQEGRPATRKGEVAELSAPAQRSFNEEASSSRAARSLTAEPIKWRRTKPSGITPVGLIPVTVRLRPDIAGALKRASLERQLAGDEPFSQQDIVEQAIEPWLRSNGYMT
jgi:hypothetical protein